MHQRLFVLITRQTLLMHMVKENQGNDNIFSLLELGTNNKFNQTAIRQTFGNYLVKLKYYCYWLILTREQTNIMSLKTIHIQSILDNTSGILQFFISASIQVINEC